MKNTYYITLPVDSSGRRPQTIPQKHWDGFIDDVRRLLSPEVTPNDFTPHGYKHQGSPLMDSNAISVSPPEGEGDDLVIKRNASKVLVQVKTNSQAYATIVGAILLAFKRRVTGAIVSNKLKWDGMQKGVQYFHYVLEGSAPVVHASMASEVTIRFNWLKSVPPEDCEQVLEDIRALLGGNADNISIRFDS